MGGSKKGGGKGNPFMNFMMSTRESRPECTNLTMPQLQRFCDPLWSNMSAELKAGYKYGRNRGNGNAAIGNYVSGEGCRYDTHGRLMESVNKSITEKSQREKAIKDFIAEQIRFLGRTKLAKMNFFLIDVKVWIETLEGDIIPAEIAIIKMNLAGGLQEKFHRLIHPGEALPPGYGSQMKQRLEKFKIDYYDSEIRNGLLCADYRAMYDDIARFLGQYQGVPGGYHRPASSRSLVLHQDSLNPVYYLFPDGWNAEEKMGQHLAEKALDWIALRAGQDVGAIPVLNLAEFFFQIYNRLASPNEVNSIASKLISEYRLEQDKWMYSEGLKCTEHEKHDIDNSTCSLSKVSIQGFIIADYCFGFIEDAEELIPGKHIPDQDKHYLYNDGEDDDTTYAETTSITEQEFKSIMNETMNSRVSATENVDLNEWKKKKTANTGHALLRGRRPPPPTKMAAPTPNEMEDMRLRSDRISKKFAKMNI